MHKYHGMYLIALLRNLDIIAEPRSNKNLNPLEMSTTEDQLIFPI